ncbi:MAG: AsmA-like C-terminal region-containing protein, partial [Myxococcales bacterium]
MRGELKVENLEQPRVDMRIASKLLDVDELLGEPQEKPKQDGQPAPAGESRPREDDPSLKQYAFKGLFTLDRVLYGGDEYRNFRGEVTLQDGVLRLVDCTFEMFGGTISARGSEAEIWRGKMPFKANLALKGIDLNQALSAKTQYKDLVFGLSDLNLSVSGRGFETKDLEESLNGALELAMKQGRFAKGSVTRSVLGDTAVLSKVPGVKLDKLQADNAIRDLLASFEIKNGRLNLKKPMALGLDRSRMALDGAIGIAGGLFMKGTYFVSPDAVASVSNGKCAPKEELQVPIDIAGTLKEPSFRPDVKGLAGAIGAACVAGRLDDLAGKAADQLKAKLGVSS